MKQERRTLLRAVGHAAALSACALLSAAAFAQSVYPNKPITMVLPSAAGGGTDSMGRSLAEAMSKELGQTIIVDNKAGAGGVLGAQTVARAPADGYTILFSHSGPIYYAPYLHAKLPYDIRRDFAFVSRVSDVGMVMIVNPSVPAQNMTQLVSWIKQQRAKNGVSYGSYGSGTVGHLLTAYLSDAKDLGMTHIPYKGEAPMLQDVIGNQVPMAIASVGTVLPLIASGKLRAVGVFDKKRLEDLPDVPTLPEEGFTDPEYEVVGGMTLLAPAGIPPAVLARLESAARAASMSPLMRAKLKTYGAVPLGTTSQEARQTFERSQPRIEKLVRISGVKPE